MKLSFKILTLCFLCQILPGKCTSSEELDERLDEENDSSARKEVEYDSNEAKTLERKPDSEYEAEKKAGDPADLFGSNQHRSYPTKFIDFGRRFVPVYPYREASKQKNKNEELVPIEATPEEVIAEAVKSAIDQASMLVNNSEAVKMEKEILRTGDYWNALWVEDVNPKSVLRSYTEKQLKNKIKNRHKSSVPKLGSVRAKIMPGSKLYQLVSVLQQYSPRLLYVINKNQ